MHKASGRDWRINFLCKGAVMFYLGIDVAKAKLDCCLLLDEAGGKRKTKVVPNSKAGIAILLEWTANQNVLVSALHVIMEATCVYHEQAAFRDRLVQLGATRFSCGSKTGVGGYAVRKQEEAPVQFSVTDNRSVEEVAAMLRRSGYQPIFKDWEIV